jgi:hypothetical protein
MAGRPCSSPPVAPAVLRAGRPGGGTRRRRPSTQGRTHRGRGSWRGRNFHGGVQLGVREGVLVNDIRDDDLGLSRLPLLIRCRRDVESLSWTASLLPTQHRYRCSTPAAAPAVAAGRPWSADRRVVPRNLIGWVSAKGLSGRVEPWWPPAAGRRVCGAVDSTGGGGP